MRILVQMWSLRKLLPKCFVMASLGNHEILQDICLDRFCLLHPISVKWVSGDPRFDCTESLMYVVLTDVEAPLLSV